ncbi:MAG: TetR family transcriptional regulator [Ilumatobacteraceae bacterium]
MNVAVSTTPKSHKVTDRADRTRTAIVNAFVALVRERETSPAIPEVARRAGVSLRSVYYHFRDTESLHAAVIARHEPLILQIIVSLDRGAPLRSRVRNLVAQRCEVYRLIAPLRRAVQSNIQVRTSSAIRAARRRLEYVLARHVNETFAGELRAIPDRFGASKRIAAATSFEMWDYLSRVQRLSASRVERHMVVAVLHELGA